MTTDTVDGVSSEMTQKDMVLSRYKAQLRQTHQTTVHGRECDEYDPTAEKREPHGDTLVWCDTCNVVLDTLSLDGGETDD